MRELLSRLRDWLRRDRLDAELKEEMDFHRAPLERDARAEGVAPEDAAWAARRQLGNITRVTEEARDRWSIPGLDHLRQDAHVAIRGLRRSPGFAIAVILTLGLGIGANAAMFGVIDRSMFRPYPSSARSRERGPRLPADGRIEGRQRLHRLPYTRYLDLRRWTTSFSQYAAFVTATRGVGTGDAARTRGVLGVSASFFDFFDARPALGRFFAAAEDSTPTGTNVAVLSFAFWKADYDGRDVIGESIPVGSASYTIIGVAPERFVGVSEASPPAVFIPIAAYAANEDGEDGSDYFRKYNWDWAEMMVRRKPGVSRAAATPDLSSAMLLSWNASRILATVPPRTCDRGRSSARSRPRPGRPRGSRRELSSG